MSFNVPRWSRSCTRSVCDMAACVLRNGTRVEGQRRKALDKSRVSHSLVVLAHDIGWFLWDLQGALHKRPTPVYLVIQPLEGLWYCSLNNKNTITAAYPRTTLTPALVVLND